MLQYRLYILKSVRRCLLMQQIYHLTLRYMIMIQKEVETSVAMTLTMLALYNPLQVLLRQRHRQTSIMRQRKPRRPSNATSVMNVHSNTCLWRSPDDILLRLLELIQVATWMSSRRQRVEARTHTYNQSLLPHELQAMDCIVKVVVIDRFSCTKDCF